MRIYSLKRVQNIPTSLDKAWDFFSSPFNLGQITPPEIKFEILHRTGDSWSVAGPCDESQQSLGLSGKRDTSRGSTISGTYSPHHADPAYAGQLIEYKLSPLPGFRFYWMTEITHVVPGRYFVDEQRRGPYRMWHHQHHFRKIEGGIEMTDIVHYQMPLGVVGVLAHGLFVGRQLERIFAFRTEKIREIFGSMNLLPGAD